MGINAYQPEASLTIPQRDKLLEDLDRDGYFVLPERMPAWMLDEGLRVIDRLVDQRRMFEPDTTYINYMDIIEMDPIFRRMMMYKPMLQMTYDVFGPQFILMQDQFAVKYHNPKDANSWAVGWHTDAPTNFPQVNGVVGLHTLRFGFLLSDAMDERSGCLEVIRGSHKKPVLHARKGLAWRPYEFRQDDFVTNRVTVKAPAGTIVAFNTAVWHSAGANQMPYPRKIVYIQFCPTWMRQLHRNPPTMADLQAYSAEERWLLGEPRPAPDYVWENPEIDKRLARFSREAT